MEILSLLILKICITIATANSSPCSLTTPSPSQLTPIILDIEESLGNSTNQQTTPLELPIQGDPWNEVELALLGTDHFVLRGKRLELIKVLDRDSNDLSSVVFQATCKNLKTNATTTIPVIVRIADLNDNAPVFVGAPYTVEVEESTPVGSPIFRSILAKDIDAGVNGLVEYRVDHDFFTVNHKGVLTLNKSLDFEDRKEWLVGVVAEDLAFQPTLRKSSKTTIRVVVRDSDDLPPVFSSPSYNSTLTLNVLTGILEVQPQGIKALDQDTLNYEIIYEFLNGTDDYQDYFVIDPQNGLLRQIRALTTKKNFEIFIKATEKSRKGLFAVAKLEIFSVDVSLPPTLSASSSVGYIQENSPSGTKVLDVDGNFLEFFSSTNKFELTTDLFTVSKNYLVVKGKLDRELMDKLVFQIISRDNLTHSTSIPLTITVHIRDEDDNSPVIRPIGELRIPAIAEGRHRIVHVLADDKDSNPTITYSIAHVSNNASARFFINASTGLLEAVGPFKSGEQFSLTIQATDPASHTHQQITEISVVDGPNLKAPIFSQPIYDVRVSEGAELGTEVISLVATDPEGKQLTYEIIHGNELGHFAVSRNGGVVVVSGPLDREDVDRYQLTITASDGAYTTPAQLQIRLTDINDQNPTFPPTPPTFTVKENLPPSTPIGVVSATDGDSLYNQLTYSISSSLFAIDPASGLLTTLVPLDYEAQAQHKLLVTARDNGDRIATTVVLIDVLDVPDSPPVFRQFTYDAVIDENAPPPVQLLRVEAIDADSEKKITYFLKQGDFGKFGVDGVTGAVYTKERLDYEEKGEWALVVGLEENEGLGGTASVFVRVRDLNDCGPSFTHLPATLTLEDSTPLSAYITRVEASDCDSSYPFNKVKYEISPSSPAHKFFEINHDNGEIRLKTDLRKSPSSEFYLSLLASDLGSPPLSTQAQISIRINHTPTNSTIKFAESHSILEVPESTPPKTLKNFTIINPDNLPTRCELLQSYDNLFQVLSHPGHCELLLTRAALDAEKIKSYDLKIEVASFEKKVSSKVSLRVLDENDNEPEFVGGTGKLYAVVDEGGGSEENVVELQVADKDESDVIQFRVDSPQFTVSSKGIVRSVGKLQDTNHRVLVTITDGEHSVEQTLIVNVLRPKNRFKLKVKASKVGKEELVKVLQDCTGLIAGIEKTRLVEDGTEVIFYLIDPATDFVLSREDSKVKEVLSREGRKEIVYFVGSVFGVESEVEGQWEGEGGDGGAQQGVGIVERLQVEEFVAFPAALVALAVVVFFVGSGAVCFLCYKYERVGSSSSGGRREKVGIEGASGSSRYYNHSLSSSLKEYETQVLEMRVNELDIDDSDLQVDLNSTRNHSYHAKTFGGDSSGSIRNPIYGSDEDSVIDSFNKPSTEL